MKHTLWKWKFLTFLLLILFSCQKDELLKNENEPHQHIGENSTKIVSAEDIPKVMEFLNRKTHGQDGFEIRLSMMQGMQTFSDEPDLVFAELVTDNVMAYTNEAGITNYSFQMSFENEPEFENEVSFFNLIVKEINTEEGFYSYIQEYRADKEWYLNSGWLFDMHTYTGKMIFYTLEGLYVARVTFLGGEIIENHFGSPCPNPDDPTSGDPVLVVMVVLAQVVRVEQVEQMGAILQKYRVLVRKDICQIKQATVSVLYWEVCLQ